MSDSRTVNHTIAARLQALSLVEHGVGIDAAATASGMTYFYNHQTTERKS